MCEFGLGWILDWVNNHEMYEVGLFMYVVL